MRRSPMARARDVWALAGPAGAASRGHGRHVRCSRQGACPTRVGINSLWVIVAGCFVMFMQAGFAFLEIGFSRGKNAGTVVAKILDELLDRRDLVLGRRLRVRLRRRPPATSSATHGFFLRDFGDPQTAFPIMGLSDATIESKLFFQFVFCAVSLAIVWGTTLERIKFGVYVIYAIVFSRAHLPDRLGLGLRRRLAAGQRRHAGLRRLDGGPPDRRDRRARGAAAARPARGQVRPRRQAAGHPRPQHAALRPRRADPVARLVRLQPGLDARRARRPLHRGRCSSRNIAAAAGVLGALLTAPPEDEARSTSAWPATARSARSSPSPRPSGYVAPWAGAGHRRHRRRHRRRSASTRSTSKLDDPVGALTAHGLCGIWGTLACGLFTLPALAAYNAVGEAGPVLHGLVPPARRPGARRGRSVFAFVFVGQLRRPSGSSRRPTACA